MRLAFFGTPMAAVPSLKALIEAPDVELAAVVTNPDRRRGRSSKLVPPPVKEVALAADLDVWQPERASEIAVRLSELRLDAVAIVAYGSLLPAAVLSAGGRGFVNLHFSLLPRWRGAAPVQHALIAGDHAAGVTTFVLDQGMDTGPVLQQHAVQIETNETAGDLTARLATQGAEVLIASIRAFVDGLTPTPQPTSGVTLAPKLTAADVRIDWSRPPSAISNLVRAANPAPGAHTSYRGRRLRVWSSLHAEAAQSATPGTFLGLSGDALEVACSGGSVQFQEVQPDGRSRMSGRSFANGYRVSPGEVLGH